jgi:hypothetical protein
LQYGASARASCSSSDLYKSYLDPFEISNLCVSNLAICKIIKLVGLVQVTTLVKFVFQTSTDVYHCCYGYIIASVFQFWFALASLLLRLSRCGKGIIADAFQDRIGSGISTTCSCRVEKIPESTRIELGEVCLSDDRCFEAVFSVVGQWHCLPSFLALRELRIRGENARYDLCSLYVAALRCDDVARS